MQKIEGQPTKNLLNGIVGKCVDEIANSKTNALGRQNRTIYPPGSHRNYVIGMS